MKFYATIEYLSGQRAAIVTLRDGQGEWAGASRVEAASRQALYEQGYNAASLSAIGKGGRLETYRPA